MARKQTVLTETTQNIAVRSQVVGTGGTLETSGGKPRQEGQSSSLGY